MKRNTTQDSLFAEERSSENTLSNAIECLDISMTAESKGKKVTEWSRGNNYAPLRVVQDSWLCTVGNDLGKMSVTMYMGEGYNGHPPTTSDVMYAIINDAQLIETHDFDEFVVDFGYDKEIENELKRALKIWDACKAERTDLIDWLGYPIARQLMFDTDLDE